MSDLIDRAALRAAFHAETWGPGQVLQQFLALIDAAPRAATEADEERCPRCLFRWRYHGPNHEDAAPRAATERGGKEQPQVLLADVTVDDLVEAWKLPDPIDHIWFMATDTCLCGAKVPDSAWFERHRAEAVLGRLRASAGARAQR